MGCHPPRVNFQFLVGSTPEMNFDSFVSSRSISYSSVSPGVAQMGERAIEQLTVKLGPSLKLLLTSRCAGHLYHVVWKEELTHPPKTAVSQKVPQNLQQRLWFACSLQFRADIVFGRTFLSV